MQNRRRRYGLDQTKFLTEDEWTRFEIVAKRELGSTRVRDALLMLLALRTGARATELLEIRPKDFFPGTRTVLIHGVKGSKDRELALPNYLADALSRYIEDKAIADDARVFDFSYAYLRKIWLWYRPAKKTFHSLRHTFGLNVYIKTKDIRLVQTALGHVSISNTLIYVDYAYSLREMRQIIF